MYSVISVNLQSKWVIHIAKRQEVNNLWLHLPLGKNVTYDSTGWKSAWVEGANAFLQRPTHAHWVSFQLRCLRSPKKASAEWHFFLCALWGNIKCAFQKLLNWQCSHDCTSYSNTVACVIPYILLLLGLSLLIVIFYFSSLSLLIPTLNYFIPLIYFTKSLFLSRSLVHLSSICLQCMAWLIPQNNIRACNVFIGYKFAKILLQGRARWVM